MHQLSEQEWTAIVAHRLHRHWRRLDVAQLDELAAELWRDARYRPLAPAEAAEIWLALLRGECGRSA